MTLFRNRQLVWTANKGNYMNTDQPHCLCITTLRITLGNSLHYVVMTDSYDVVISIVAVHIGGFKGNIHRKIVCTCLRP